MSLTAGRRLGPYEVVAAIGSGGTGEVWRATDTRLSREVAVKVLPAGLADNETFRARFEREARIVSQLSHPHVCTLFDVGQEGDVHFLAWSCSTGSLSRSGCARDRDLCLKSLRDDEPPVLAHESETWSYPGSWLPDGSGFLVVEQDPVTNDDIFVRPLEDQEKMRSLVRSPAYDSYPELSRDGRWLAYLSDEIGSVQLYVRPMSASSRVWQLSSGGALTPRWRADGREIYFIAPDGTVMVVPIQAGPEFRPGEPQALFRVPGQPGEDLVLLEDVSPDGQRFLLNLPVESRSHVGFRVVANWPALATREAR